MLFTAFCRETTDEGTTWISVVSAPNRRLAVKEAKTVCASDWDVPPDQVRCIGLIVGNVTIAYWDDGETIYVNDNDPVDV